MVYVSCSVTLLLSTVVLADHYIDNADTSVSYSMPAIGQSWQTFTVGITSLELQLSNSTGNYSIPFDGSNCFDQNYTQGKCSTGDKCSIFIPFTGSGITIYVFNAGTTGMTANFSVDGRAAVSNSTAPPTAAQNYQASNVSLYDVQGLTSGNHSIKMTLMDWDGTATDMKFDYAHVNESFVAVPSSTTASPTPTTTSKTRLSTQTPTQPPVPTASALNRINIGVGGIVGITLGVVAVLGGIVIGIIFYRKRRASHLGSTALDSTFQIEPFTEEYLNSITSSSRPHIRYSSSLSLQSDENSPVPPLMRSAILRDAHAVGNLFSSAPVVDEAPSAVLGSTVASRYNLTPAQVETLRGLLARNLGSSATAAMISLVIEAFVSDEANAGQVIPSSEYARSLELPPSYQTRDR